MRGFRSFLGKLGGRRAVADGFWRCARVRSILSMRIAHEIGSLADARYEPGE